MNPFVTIAAILGLGVMYVVVPVMLREYRRYRGTRLVTCPETQQPATVALDARHAALTGFLADPNLRLAQCSRWPERQECGRECLGQIADAPDGCLVRSLVGHWYEGKSCALCETPLDSLDHWGHQLALMSPEGETMEWGEVRPEMLPSVLASYRPLCWNCHISETFRHRYPELVVDRKRPEAQHPGA
jgi:hypothetical protein